MGILRDSVWQFVGVILAILVPLIGWWFGARKKEKSLSYENPVILSLLFISEEVRNRISIWYKGRIIENLYVIVVTLYNDGREPILPEEFIEPVRFLLPKGSNILSAEVTDTTPPELKPRIKFSIEPEKITITPTLLNQNDAVTIKMLVENKNTLLEPIQQHSELKVDARIVGVSKIPKKDRFSRIQKLREGSIFIFSLIIGSMLIALCLNVLAKASSTPDDKLWAQTVLGSMITAAVGYLIGKRATSS